MAKTLRLVRTDGTVYDYTLSGKALPAAGQTRFEKRTAFAAAHVVVDPLRTREPLTDPVIDCSQLSPIPRCALELIERSARAAKSKNAKIARGAGTDQLPVTVDLTLQEVKDAYLEQHLPELFVLADKAGLLRDSEMATARMGNILSLSGVA